jgi:hypothetical protein
MKLQVQLDKQRAQNQDTLSTSAYRVSYTVNVVDASLSTLKSTSAVSAITGAVVKLVQDTTILKQTVDASGMVTFTNLKPGNANVNITLGHYSEVNYTVNLSQNSINGGRQFSNIIPLIPISGTTVGKIQGKVIFESDLTNNTPEPVPAGTKVIAMVSASSNALPTTGSNGIISISYDSLALTATTYTDGTFEMKVPTTLRGLDYDIIVPDFTVGQKLLQNTYNNRDTSGVVTIATNFGNSFTSASSIDAVSPVIITVGAPDYSFTPAQATAVINNVYGIDYIQISGNGVSGNGRYYYPSTTFTSVPLDNPAPASNGAYADIYVNSVGNVYKIDVTTKGANYPTQTEGAGYTLPYIRKVAKAVVLAVDGSGAITSWRVVPGKQGEFYSYSNLEFVKQSGGSLTGSGAILPIPTPNNGGASLWLPNSIQTPASPLGQNYAVNDTFVLSVKAGQSDILTGVLHMTTGSVTAISVTNQGDHYISGKVDAIISAPGVGGTIATTNAPTVINGKIAAITIATGGGGSGYTSAPTVTIVNKAEKSQAKFKATVSSDGKVTGVSPASSGNGYLTVPAVNVTSVIPGQGSGASFYATISGGAVSLTLVNQGNGYRGNLPSSSKSYSPPSINVKGNGTTIINIDLGTGKRTIEQ